MGLLLTDIKRTYVQSRLKHFSSEALPEMEQVFAALTVRAREESRMEQDVQIERLVDLRYVGQGYELSVPLRPGTLDADCLEQASRQFHQMHQEFYGNAAPGKPLEMISLRIKTMVPLKKLSLPKLEPAEAGSKPAPASSRPVYFEEADGRVATSIYHRSTLRPGHHLLGPAIIDQTDSTTVLLPGQRAEVDPYGNILIETG